MRSPFEASSMKPRKFLARERAALLRVVASVGGVSPASGRNWDILPRTTYANMTLVKLLALLRPSLGVSCWKNSPQAKRAIEAAIQMADEYIFKQNAKAT